MISMLAGMDGFVEAVKISCDAFAHPELRSKALQHIADVEASPDAWLMCMEGLTNNYWGTIEAQYYSYKVIEKTVRHRYDALGEEDRETLREFLLSFYRNHELNQPKPIRNKVAQIFALLFLVEYPNAWPTYFQDLILHLSHHPSADLYLRILAGIDEQVIAKEITRSDEETKASMNLKNAMRDLDLPRIAESWFQLIETYSGAEAEVVAHCLDVMSDFVSWIDVDLIINAKGKEILQQCLCLPAPIREAACRTIDAIILKGMPAAARLCIIDELQLPDLMEQLYATAEGENDVDFMMEIARLTNSCLLTLTGGLSELEESSAEALTSHERILRIVPLAIALFNSEDDGVSERMTSSINAYIQLLKQKSALSADEKLLFERLVAVTISKMKFDGEQEFDNEESLGLFHEFRAQLKSVLVNLSHIDLQELVSITAEHVHTLLTQQEDWTQAELGLHVVYVMQEIATALPYEEDGALTRWGSMLERASFYPVDDSCPEPLLLKYFEVLGRLSKFLVRDVEHLTHALGTFFTSFGMQHPSSALRSRCCYLLCSLLKDKDVREAAASIIGQLVEYILPFVHPSGLQEETGRLNLLEAVSWLLAHESITTEAKWQQIEQFVEPLLEVFRETLATEMRGVGSAAEQENRINLMSYIISAVMRLSKGFAKLDESPEDVGLLNCFSRALSTFLQALALPPNTALTQAVRMFFHRMIVVLGAGVLQELPTAVQGLLSNPSAKELEEFVPLIIHLIQKFRGDFAPFLEAFFLAFVQTIFRILNENVEENDLDSQQQQRDLRRAYFTFVGAIVTNGLTDVFITEENRESLQDILTTLVQGASQLGDDPKAIKSCFGTLRELISRWITPEGCSVPGFEDFARTHIVEACFSAMLQPSFNVQDVQYFGALTEIATILLLLAGAYPSEFIEYLRSNILCNLLAPDIAAEFAAHLEQSAMVSVKAGKKRLSAFLKHLIIRLQASS
eukprot:m.152450 g.152450  ORF g.152450 m.152450 type:complete len:970 (-) comp16211_c0_seq1:417-3326(-)